MKKDRLKTIILGLVVLAFIVFALISVVIGIMVFFHALANPELTLTQNFLWIFESKFRSVVVIGSIITYFGLAAIGSKK